ncbi:hypothetical protein ACOMHN_004790 [Nucella lapillus]
MHCGRVSDAYCWLCHKDDCSVGCQLCPRTYHLRCLTLASVPTEWVCGECEKIMEAECMDSRSKAMKQISTDTLCLLLRYALDRMRQPGSEVFQKPANMAELPSYSDFIVSPMDFSTLEKNIKKKEYGCTEAFLADAKWILHNCIIYNGLHHKLTTVARNVVKSSKHEMSEIEVCPQCYKHSCVKGEASWFIEPCDPPHPLVWAKLKGYPFWPAKAMEEVSGGIDVRFFGAHDKSVVPVSHVFMLSKDPPTAMGKKKGGFASAMDEMEVHIDFLRKQHGMFDYAPFRTPYDRRQVYMNNKLKSVNMMAAKRFKMAAHGRLAVKGKEAEKVSAVSKTVSAVKSKYSSLVIKKCTPTKAPALSQRAPASSPDTAEKAIRKALNDCGRTAASKSRFINPVVSVTDIIQRKIHRHQELDRGDTGTESAETGTKSAETGTESAETGTESAETGTESAETGTESAETGTESAETGTESAETGTEPGEMGTQSGEMGTQSKEMVTESGEMGTQSGETGTESGETGSGSGEIGTGETGTESGENRVSATKAVETIEENCAEEGLPSSKERDGVHQDKPSQDKTAEEQSLATQTVTAERPSKTQGSSDETQVKTTEAEVVSERESDTLEKEPEREVIVKNKALRDTAERSEKGGCERLGVTNKQDGARKEEEEKPGNREKSSGETPLVENSQVSATDDQSEHSSASMKSIQESCTEEKKEESTMEVCGSEKSKTCVTDHSDAVKPGTSMDRSARGLSKSCDERRAVSSENVTDSTPDSTSEQVEFSSSPPVSPKSSSGVVTTTVSPQSGQEYRDSLLKTIEACKGKLGITHVDDDVEEPMDVSDDDDESILSKNTQGRDGESETVAESQVSSDSQDSRIDLEMEVDQKLESETSSQKRLESEADSDSTLDMFSAASDGSGQTQHSEKEGGSSTEVGEAQHSEKEGGSSTEVGEAQHSEKEGGSSTEVGEAQHSRARTKTDQLHSDAGARSGLKDMVTNLPSSSAPGVDRLAKPTEDPDCSVGKGVVTHNKGSNVDSESTVSCPEDSQVYQIEATSSQSNAATYSVIKPSGSKMAGSSKVAGLSSVLEKDTEKCTKSASEWGKGVSSNQGKMLLNFSAQVSSSVSSESSSDDREASQVGDGVSCQSPCQAVQPTAKTATGTLSGTSRVSAITINDDDEPSLLMEVETAERDEEALVIDLDEENSDTNESNTSTPDKSTLSGFVKELAPSPGILKGLSKSPSNVSPKKTRKLSKKKQVLSADLTVPSSVASSEPCGMMISDVRSLSGLMHEWKEDGNKESLPPPSLPPPAPVPASLPQHQPQPPPPAQSQQEPSQEPPQPTQESSQPSQKSSQPSQKSSQLSQEPSQPLQEPSQPLQEPSQPLQEPSQPLQKSSQPSQEPSQPSQDPSQPSQEPSQPSQESSQPLQVLSQPRQRQADTSQQVYQVLRQQLLYKTLEKMQSQTAQQQQQRQEPLQQTLQQVQKSMQQPQQVLHQAAQSAAAQPQSRAPPTAVNSGRSLLLHNFRMPPTPPVEQSQGNAEGPSTGRSLPRSRSDGNRVSSDPPTSSHAERPSDECRLSDRGALALTPAAVNLVNIYSQKIVGNTQLQLAEMTRALLASVHSEREGLVEKRLKEEKEHLQWAHEVQMAEVQHNHKLMIAEMKACWEAETSKALNDLKKKLTAEKEEAVTEAKKKQWCATCWKEAIFYCCWNTSYCSYACQQQHWTLHQQHCRQVLDAQPPTTTALSPSTVMVAGRAAAGFVSVQATGGQRNTQTSGQRNDAALTQTVRIQKPNTGMVNVVQGGDMWRNRLPQNIQVLSAQLPGSSQAMKLLSGPPPSVQALQQFQYVRSMGPNPPHTFQPSSLSVRLPFLK